MRVLFITSASHTPSQRNYNHFQRVDFLSRHTELTLWVRKGADFSASASPGTHIRRASIGGKLGLFLHVVRCALTGQARQFDVVLTEPSLLSLMGALCKAFGATRWVVDVWDVPGRLGGVHNMLLRLWLRLNRYILKQAFQFADLFLLSIRHDYEFAYFNIPSVRLLLMKNAIRLDEFQKLEAQPDTSTAFNILCTRSVYHSDMGLDTLAAAYDRLRRTDNDFTLTIVGRIPQEVRPQIAALEHHPNVEFADFLEQESLKERITRSDVCVVPFKDVTDLAQTYPIKVVEYMALGKPVIVSRIAGMRELITDGESGLHFRAGDPLDLAEKILLVWNDRTMAAKLGDNAKSASAAFDYAIKGRRILAALNSLFAP